MFCRSLFVLLYFFFWPLCCLFFFDIWILITLWYLQTLFIDLLCWWTSYQTYWLITRFVAWVTRRVLLVEQKLPTSPEHTISPRVFRGVRAAYSFAFWVMFCLSLFVCLSLFSFVFCHCHCLCRKSLTNFIT